MGLGVASLHIFSTYITSSHRRIEGGTEDTQIQEIRNNIDGPLRADQQEHVCAHQRRAPSAVGCETHCVPERVADPHDRGCIRLPDPDTEG